jgi:quercetin dioxygenase-like cupin family protein
MDLKQLFAQLESVFSGSLAIESHVRHALQSTQTVVELPSSTTPLPKPFLDVITRINANPICKLIAETPFNWVPPRTSSDPLYVEHSRSKVHVELLGPSGLVKSNQVRLGLYGMKPNAEYGIRTHPAEEIFIMLAGEVDWKLSTAPYARHFPGDQSYHPSMMPHASRTREEAFISVYAWHGEISTDSYVYEGIPSN